MRFWTDENAARPSKAIAGSNLQMFAEEALCPGHFLIGNILLRLSQGGVQTIWSGDDLLSNHYATSVELDGFLYGIHGRTDPGFSPRPILRCVELKNKRVCWEADSIGAATRDVVPADIGKNWARPFSLEVRPGAAQAVKTFKCSMQVAQSCRSNHQHRRATGS